MAKSKLCVVFVCTFNICRSVVAEHFLRKLILEEHKELSNSIEIISSGIVTKEMSQLLKQKQVPEPPFGRGCSQQVIEIASKYGIDVSGHRSRIFNEYLAGRADLIITMEEFQKREILSRYSQAYGRVFTFREFFEIPKHIIIEDSHVLPEYRPDMGEYFYPYEYDDKMINAIKENLSRGGNIFYRRCQGQLQEAE